MHILQALYTWGMMIKYGSEVISNQNTCGYDKPTAHNSEKSCDAERALFAFVTAADMRVVAAVNEIALSILSGVGVEVS